MKYTIEPKAREFVSCCKMLVRTNIKAIYLPIDESLITTKEVVDQTTGQSRIETVYPELVLDYWEADESFEYYTAYAQFTTLKQYAIQNQKIVTYKDQQTKGEFERTETEYYYTPEPEPAWNGMFYMEAKPEFQEAGLFTDCTLLDSIPIEEVEE